LPLLHNIGEFDFVRGHPTRVAVRISHCREVTNGGDAAMAVARFLSQPIGRIIRAVAGLALVVLAFLAIGGTLGIVVGVAGLVVIAAGPSTSA
jgi:hypothetical protein